MLLLKLLLFVVIATVSCHHQQHTNNKRALQKSHEKPKAVKWSESFFGKTKEFDRVKSLVNLIKMLSSKYLKDCTPVILYDEKTENNTKLLLEQLLKDFPVAYVHGQIVKNKAVSTKILTSPEKCVNYILFLADVMRCRDIIGKQNTNKVIVIARSSQWRVNEFLTNEISQSFVNLLVIVKSEKAVLEEQEQPYILYTHKLYVDGLGSSTPVVLTSWYRSRLTQRNVELFPVKMKEGFAGHRFVISLAHQPPFIIKRDRDENDDVQWDGIEVRLIKLLAQMYNFTIDFKEAKSIDLLGSGDAVIKEIKQNKADIGLSGIYVTQETIDNIDVSYGHSRDCAAFISLTSTALSRYRAIMGPFKLTVWLCLTAIYLFAIFPLAYTDKLTLRHLLRSPEEVENMFWYVFGTFTNCFTFSSARSWSKSDKITTRILIGFYWIFTIIITACYTGSIIAFVTIPVYPATTDTVKQLLAGRYQIGTLDKGGWQYWYTNSSDPATKKLFKNIEYVPNVEAGLKNTTKAFFWSYAFLGSRAQLDYIVRTNFTTKSKRSMLHIGSECFVPYDVAVVFTFNSVYSKIISSGILRALQNGFIEKIKHDVEWEVIRSATGRLLQVSYGVSVKALTVEDRALTTEDTQGMFLLLGIGFLLGGACLLSEWLGGCFNFCRKRRRSSASSIASNSRHFNNPTPREKLESLTYNNLGVAVGNLTSILDAEHATSNNNVGQNCSVDVMVHNHEDTEKMSEASDDTDFEEQIDMLFNIEELFGEENTARGNENVETIDEK